MPYKYSLNKYHRIPNTLMHVFQSWLNNKNMVEHYLDCQLFMGIENT